MESVWLINSEDYQYEINIGSYSCIFDNFIADEIKLLDDLAAYLQPRSKVKDIMSVRDMLDGEEEITHHQFRAHKVSNEMLLEDTELGSKSYLKSKIKNELLQRVETDGYLMTINTLVEDLLNMVESELPLKSKKFTADLFMKLIAVDFEEETAENLHLIYNKLKMVLPLVVDNILEQNTPTPLLLYYYPENYLSPREQVYFKNLLNELSSKINILVLTKSRHFIENDIKMNNFIITGNQIFTHQYLEELEWEAPVDFTLDQLNQALSLIFKRHIWDFEAFPHISNHESADIVLFKDIDFYVLCKFLNDCQFEYTLSIDSTILGDPVHQYILDHYERR